MAPETLNWIPVSSSNLSDIAFDEQDSTLYVRFSNGSEYSYSGVPQALFNELRMAGSKGQFLNMKIKGYYPCEREN